MLYQYYNNIMKRQQFLDSKEVQIVLVNVEKKIMHRQRFIIEIVTDKKVQQVKKTFREWRYFNKLVNEKIGIKQLQLTQAYWPSDRYKNLQIYIHKLNSGYLYYHERNPKARELRQYVYSLLFQEDALFVDGVDDSSDEQMDKQKMPNHSNDDLKLERKKSSDINSDLKPLILNTIKHFQGKKTSSETQNSLKSILKKVNRCWIKSVNPNSKERGQTPYIWEQYELVLHDKYLHLKSQTQNKIIIINNYTVQIILKDTIKLLMYHHVDQDPLELRLSKYEEGKNEGHMYEKYLALYTNLKELVNEQKNYHVVNKLKIRIMLKKNTKNQHDKKDDRKGLNFKIIHGIETTVMIPFQSHVDVHVPIVDNFGQIDFDVTELKENSFLPNIKQSHFHFHLSVQSIYDYVYNNHKPKKKQTEIKSNVIELKSTKSALHLEYKLLSNWKAMAEYNTEDQYQGQQPSQQLNREELRMSGNRLKRIAFNVGFWVNKVKDIQQFTYPRLSYLLYFIISLFILFYDHNDFLIAFIMMLLIILIYNNSTFHLYFWQFISLCKLNHKVNNMKSKLMNRNVYLREQLVRRKQDIEKELFVQQFQLTRKNKRSIYKKYKRLQSILYQAQNVIYKLVTMVEKFKNLFIWYYYQKTKVFFLILVIILVGLLILPLRLMLLVALFRTMKKGEAYHRKTQQMNKMIILELFRVIVEENNLKNFHQYLLHQQKKIEKQNNSEYVVFAKKVKDTFQNSLQLQYNNEKMFESAQSIKDILNYLCKSKEKFLLPAELCVKHGFNIEWSRKKSTSSEIVKLIYGFLVTIPSDKHIMGVKTIHDGDDDDDEEDEFMNI